MINKYTVPVFEAYTKEAKDFLSVNKAEMVSRTIGHGEPGFRIRTKTHFGIYSLDDRIVTYGPR